VIKLLAAKLLLDSHFQCCEICKPAVADWRSLLGTPAEVLQPALCDAGIKLRKEHTSALTALPFETMQAYISLMIAAEKLEFEQTS
jgi:hypothetical protein